MGSTPSVGTNLLPGFPCGLSFPRPAFLFGHPTFPGRETTILLSGSIESPLPVRLLSPATFLASLLERGPRCFPCLSFSVQTFGLPRKNRAAGRGVSRRGVEPVRVRCWALEVGCSMFSGLPWPHLPRRIEFRCQHTNEQFFAMTGGFFRVALIPLDARHAMQQPDDPARQPLRVCDTRGEKCVTCRVVKNLHAHRNELRRRIAR